MKTRTILSLAAAALLLVGCHKEAPAPTPAEQLVSRLTELSKKGMMYGHQDDPFYGITWQWERGRSDTYELVGDYPAVMGFDLGGIEMGDAKNLDSVPFEWIREEAIAQVERGGIITFSWHPRNPRTGGTAWDVSDTTVVRNILEGGDTHELFVLWMERVRTFLCTITNEEGEPLPFILRPWHEYNGSWFWWGQKLCSDSEYIALWEMFHDYMMEAMPTNIVWACTPNMQGGWTEEKLLARWPKCHIDIVGADVYQWGAEEDFIKSASEDFDFLAQFAHSRGMLFTISECGFQNSPVADWWSRVFMPIAEGHEACYFLPWRNWHKEHFGASPDATTASDFKQLAEQNRFLLLSDIAK